MGITPPYDKRTELICTRRFQEYPGSVWHKDYELICPICNRQTKDFGGTETLFEEIWKFICDECAKETL